MITNLSNQCNTIEIQKLDEHFLSMKTYIKNSVENGTAAHEVEKNLFEKILDLGKNIFALFFKQQGYGDVGEYLELEAGHSVKRLEKHRKIYRSVFGVYDLDRYVYGSRKKQKFEVIPLDSRLNLPESEYSYFLQDWMQLMTVEMPFRTSMELLHKILPSVKTTVNSLERINRASAEQVENFRKEQPDPNPETEGQIIVSSADGKGIPMIHKKDYSPIEDQIRKGPKPDRKKMAIVGSVYTINPHIRTPSEVVDALFHNPVTASTDHSNQSKRPTLCHKRVIANLTQIDENNSEINATQSTFSWIQSQIEQRNSKTKKPHVVLMDGQPSLWEEQKRRFPGGNYIGILDLMHANSRIWDITNILNANDEHKIDIVRNRIFRMLHGQVKSVISGARQSATKQKLSKKDIKKLTVACQYLEKNAERMRYDDYLAKGYPIASGVIEGACRHYVKDRMERAGMKWSIDGAQAMLNMRSIYLNGDWDEFTKYRIKKESEILYSNQKYLGRIVWPIAA